MDTRIQPVKRTRPVMVVAGGILEEMRLAAGDDNAISQYLPEDIIRDLEQIKRDVTDVRLGRYSDLPIDTLIEFVTLQRRLSSLLTTWEKEDKTSPGKHETPRVVALSGMLEYSDGIIRLMLEIADPYFRTKDELLEATRNFPLDGR